MSVGGASAPFATPLEHARVHILCEALKCVIFDAVKLSKKHHIMYV